MKLLFNLSILVLSLFLSNFANGQNIYLLNGGDTVRQKTKDISISLVLNDTIIELPIGQNNFKKYNSDKCKSIQIIYYRDTLFFNEQQTFAPGTSKLLVDILSKNNPDYKLILSKNWTIITDKVPVKNEELKKSIQKNINDGTKIIALKTDKLVWAILDNNYSTD